MFNKYYKGLVVFANTFLIDIDECEDIVQNTFLQLWESKLVFPKEIALKSYLYITVKNKCLNKIKHYKVKENYQLQNKKRKEDSVLMEEGIIIQESAKLLHEAITFLSPRKKEIIDLALKGLSNKTISERLSIKIDTVKSLKTKAYKFLKAYLEKRD
ncbi:sigma-70 family RNA polymerase sigma factor [Flavivirga aquatica]|uniref:sigma-70 family RNA polymerase sigma factor n=1 Tax=Flavivirga aquatica TaxID=1849968 RepID=UPI0023E46254|nr:sigma-70 family RNA polymerase sigma factor [Flavivirga aquatica]